MFKQDSEALAKRQADDNLHATMKAALSPAQAHRYTPFSKLTPAPLRADVVPLPLKKREAPPPPKPNNPGPRPGQAMPLAAQRPAEVIDLTKLYRSQLTKVVARPGDQLLRALRRTC